MTGRLTNEGTYLDGLYVLTPAELNRAVAEQLQRRHLAQVAKAEEHRRAQWRASMKRRYARYRRLRLRAGEPVRQPWNQHLAELEGRAR